MFGNNNIMGGGGRLRLIEETELSAVSTSVTFDNIPTIYRMLYMRMMVKTDRPGTWLDDVHLTFNGDGGNNYSSSRFGGGGTGPFSQNDINSAYIKMRYAMAAVGTANNFGHLSFHINYYANNAYLKLLHYSVSLMATWNQANRFRNLVGSGIWNNTDTIASFVLVPDVGTNFVANSRFTLYGIQ